MLKIGKCCVLEENIKKTYMCNVFTPNQEEKAYENRNSWNRRMEQAILIAAQRKMLVLPQCATRK